MGGRKKDPLDGADRRKKRGLEGCVILWLREIGKNILGEKRGCNFSLMGWGKSLNG